MHHASLIFARVLQAACSGDVVSKVCEKAAGNPKIASRLAGCLS
jgi:hypothetical protein